jgi:hypothetical protein
MSPKLTNTHMAAYWQQRLAELEAMQPITPTEALAGAAQLETEAAQHEAAIRTAEAVPQERGLVGWRSDTVAARDRRNAQALGESRRQVFGEHTHALQCRSRATALREIAAQPVGAALAASITEARTRADYYQKLAAQDANRSHP